MQDPRMVPGAGATEIELALRIGSIGQVREGPFTTETQTHIQSM
jgi:chaperonin GroEL (HSP60 family)